MAGPHDWGVTEKRRSRVSQRASAWKFGAGGGPGFLLMSHGVVKARISRLVMIQATMVVKEEGAMRNSRKLAKREATASNQSPRFGCAKEVGRMSCVTPRELRSSATVQRGKRWDAGEKGWIPLLAL